MLMKCIKHDLLATYREFLGIYTALLLMALIGPFILQVGQDWMIAILVFGIFGLVVATLVITFMAIIRLYNRRMFSNEGYLTLTLPVKTHTTIISKVVTGMIWTTMTIVVFVLSLSIFGGIYFGLKIVVDHIDYTEVIQAMTVIWNTGVVWTMIQSFLIQLPLILADSIYGLILLVFVMTLVNTSFIKKYKVPAGIAIYMILCFILNNILTNLPGAVMTFTNETPSFTDIPSFLAFLKELTYTVNFGNYAITLIGSLLFIAVLGYGTWWLLEHKLEIA